MEGHVGIPFDTLRPPRDGDTLGSRQILRMSKEEALLDGIGILQRLLYRLHVRRAVRRMWREKYRRIASLRLFTHPGLTPHVLGYLSLSGEIGLARWS